MGVDDIDWIFGVPLPHIIGSKNLVITQTKVGISVADATDYIDRYRLFAWSAHDIFTTLITDNTNYNSAQEVIYDHADKTIGGIYERILLYFDCITATLDELQISYVQVEYYYA